MYLKKYQQRVISEIKEYLRVAKETKLSFETAMEALPEDMRDSLNYVKKTHEKLKLEYNDESKNGLNRFYPRVNLKIPTGGGKTILAVEAIKEYQTLFAQKKTGLVVWIVPKEIIYKQTVERLRDKGHPYRQLLDQASGGKTIIAEKGQKLSKQDIEENLVILFIMSQSVSRSNSEESLKVFKDSGGFDSFFPEDNRYDLHYQWLEKVPNLDAMWQNGEQAQLITSLGNAVRVSKPFIIIDEFHKVFTPLAKTTIDNLNPEFILGLTATPKELMNNLSKVTGLELKNEEMVKLDLHIIPPVGNIDNDWKAMLQNITNKRNILEQKAIEYKQETGQYIRPIALVQCERTGKDQRGNGFVHSEDVKEHLISEGINPSEIAIKSSDKNDIENIDLFSEDCQIRYIITQSALNEGWDCSFAYVLGIIPNVNSNTSVTQLIGRILRQPRAKKTGIKELDESYVYYSKGDTNNLLNNVIRGFEDEGLGDLVSQLQISNKPEVNPKKTVKIKEEFKKYEYAFYLPVWVKTLGVENKFRAFKYAFDIKPFLDFENCFLTSEIITVIKNSLSKEKSERNTFSITITEENQIAPQVETIQNELKDNISLSYITGRFCEVIENAFLARKKAVEFIEILKKEIGLETLSNYFSFITALLTQHLENYKHLREEQIFKEALNKGIIKLAITNDKNSGFRVPENDVITTTNSPNLYNLNLYDDVEVSTLNTLEKKVIDVLEKQETTLFWFRNKVAKNWYAIQGWRVNKIRPDFVVAKKKDNDKIEIVYLIESKGEHLLGNNDTTYKNQVFQILTEQYKNKSIKTYQIEIDFGENVLNDAVEAYLIEDKNEEQKIRQLMN
ncbi:MAG: restriction endonuclease subunit R [Flavobacteriia bacterium]|nr:MAG: restriction endonuclease subunit R [Flavobacteriia bacterium]